MSATTTISDWIKAPVTLDGPDEFAIGDVHGCREQLDSLALFEPVEWPVVSLYLDLRPDQQGRDHYDEFLRKAIPERTWWLVVCRS